ncbi:MAG: hypothetical protein IJV25_07470 [Prevotella sp.]|nr:hypothetical protein [Prevotella sp.]
MDEQVRQRKLRQLLRLTLPDGKVLCYKSATMTFVEALRLIGTDRLQEVKLENCHLPLISQEVYPRYKEWMKSIGEGWYVNTQSDSNQKYMQLVSIKQQLGLDWKVEVGADFTPSDDKVPQRKKREAQRLMVKFPDGTCICEANPVDTFVHTIKKVGVELLMRKETQYSGKPLITSTKQYNGQIEIGEKQWLMIPPKLRTS